MRHPVNVPPVPVRDDPALLAWFELCPPCTAAFRAWQCAPNPSPRLNPRVARYPHLVALLDAGGAGGPSPQAWRQTISAQLLLIRRICTRRHGIGSLGFGYLQRPFILPAGWVCPLDYPPPVPPSLRGRQVVTVRPAL